MAVVKTEGRSIPLDDATVRANDHALLGRIKDCKPRLDCDPGTTPLSRGNASESCIGISSDTEPRRDTLPGCVHENVGPRAHDRSNSHAYGGVPLPRGSGATSFEVGPDSVQHSREDVARKQDCNSLQHVREVTPRTSDYDRGSPFEGSDW